MDESKKIDKLKKIKAMFQFIKQLIVRNKDYRTMVDNGAIIIDVRSKVEYYDDHIAEAVNIPFNKMAGKAKRLKALHKPIITCCRTGLRSIMAKRVLRKSHVTVYNAGKCDQLKKQLDFARS